MVSLLLILSTSLLAAPLECRTLETMYQAGVANSYMVDLVMNSEVDVATVACLERGVVPAEVAYAARYRMEQEAAVRVWAKAQLTLLNEAAYDLTHGNTVSAVHKSQALLNASVPSDFAAVILSLALVPGVPVTFETWIYNYVPSTTALGGSISITTESSNSVEWNGHQVKGTLSIVCNTTNNVNFGRLYLPGVVFATGKPSKIRDDLHVTRARAREEGMEPVELHYFPLTDENLDKLIFVENVTLVNLVSTGAFIIEINLKDSAPQVLIFDQQAVYPAFFFASACTT